LAFVLFLFFNAADKKNWPKNNAGKEFYQGHGKIIFLSVAVLLFSCLKEIFDVIKFKSFNGF
jgi:hypothetical protein